MRELLSVDGTMGKGDPRISCNLSTTHPGFFCLTPEQMDRLVVQEPLTKHFEVEDQPFARGKFATVRRVVHRASGQSYAAKFIRKRRRTADQTTEILHEVAVLELASQCPHIVRLQQVFETPTEMVLILELAPGGELQTILDSEEGMLESYAVKFMQQILGGLSYLHQRNVAHLDLKPQNLVLTGDYPECEVKLCDFGISRYIAKGTDVRELLGTPDYVAPEVLNYEPISLATDMWSVGVLAYVLLTGYSPFGGDTKQETFCNITQCKLDFPQELFEDVSDLAKDFISRLLVKESSERLTAFECLNHPWLAKKEEVSRHLTPQAVTPQAVVPPVEVVPVEPVVLPAQEKQQELKPNCTCVHSDAMNGNAEVMLAQEEKRAEISILPSEEDLPPPLPLEPPPLPTPLTVLPGTPLLDNSFDLNSNPILDKRTISPARRHSTASCLDNRRFSLQSSSPAAYIVAQLTSTPHNRDWRTRGARRALGRNLLSIPHRENSCDRGSESSNEVSEMSSADSSSDRSSIISLDDSVDLSASAALNPSHRRYESLTSLASSVSSSSSSSLLTSHWARRGSLDFLDRVGRCWEKECDGTFARAYEKFNSLSLNASSAGSSPARETLKAYTGRSRVISNFKLAGGDVVVIQEFTHRKGSLTKQAEVHCQSVRARIKKFEMVI